jgi:hypothetical protein
VRQFGPTQPLAFLDAVPFGETAAAASRGGMLRNEHRMPFEGCLFAIISRVCGAQPVCNQFGRIGENSMQASSLKVPQFL